VFTACVSTVDVYIKSIPGFDLIDNFDSTTSVTTLIGELGWNTLEHRRQTSRLTAMYKSVNSLNSV